MNIAVIWGIWLLAFPIIEGYALWDANDRAEPLTHYVREFMAISVFFRFAVLAEILAVFVHFAV